MYINFEDTHNTKISLVNRAIVDIGYKMLIWIGTL